MTDDPELLGGQARLPHRAHRLQGCVATLWLQQLGADVAGYALEPPSTTESYSKSPMSELMRNIGIADVRDLAALRAAVRTSSSPTFVFHLAAQSLVRRILLRAGRDLRHQRDGYRARAGGRAPRAERARVRGRNQRQVLRKPRAGPRAIARTTRWAVTIPTAAARVRPNW